MLLPPSRDLGRARRRHISRDQDTRSAWEGDKTPERIIEEMTADGYLVVFNHPQWSRNVFDDLAKVDGYFAVEVYNHGCEEENHTGHAEPYWDFLLRMGRKVWGIAADDNHNRNPYGETPGEWDSFGGWVMVNAPELSCAAIADALREGPFLLVLGA